MSSSEEHYSIKVKYASGATEELTDLPAETASAIFAEAEDSDRVVSAEVTGPTGTVLDTTDRTR